MKDFSYVISNFFTHKDYLVSSELIPGTIFTPLHFAFEALLLLIIISSAVYLSKRKDKIKPVLASLWVLLIIWEAVIVTWDSVSGKVIGFDFAVNLSLYPCSLYLYTMPFLLWGRGLSRKMAYGYICTLGMLGAVINFLYPVARLTTYSCISFPAFHTFFYHGTMLFTYLVVILSGMHRYKNVKYARELFIPCLPTLLMSVPANIINYSPINADYMYFRGKFPVIAYLMQGRTEFQITAAVYAFYIFMPVLFYLPSYIANLIKTAEEEERNLFPRLSVLINKI